MAVTHVAATSASGSAQPVTIARPAGVQDGDVLVASFATNGNPGTVTPPAGWTLAPGFPIVGGTNPYQHVYYKAVTNAASEPASYSWTLSTSVAWGGGIAAYRGVDQAIIWDAGPSGAGSGTSSTSAVAPSVTTTVANCYLVGGAAANSSTVTFTPPPSMTERWDTGAGKANCLADNEVWASADATGTRTFTASASRAWTAWLGALRPAAGGTTIPAPSGHATGATVSPSATLRASTTTTESLGALFAFVPRTVSMPSIGVATSGAVASHAAITTSSPMASALSNVSADAMVRGASGVSFADALARVGAILIANDAPSSRADGVAVAALLAFPVTVAGATATAGAGASVVALTGNASATDGVFVGQVAIAHAANVAQTTGSAEALILVGVESAVGRTESGIVAGQVVARLDAVGAVANGLASPFSARVLQAFVSARSLAIALAPIVGGGQVLLVPSAIGYGATVLPAAQVRYAPVVAENVGIVAADATLGVGASVASASAATTPGAPVVDAIAIPSANIGVASLAGLSLRWMASAARGDGVGVASLPLIVARPGPSAAMGAVVLLIEESGAILFVAARTPGIWPAGRATVAFLAGRNEPRFVGGER